MWAFQVLEEHLGNQEPQLTTVSRSFVFSFKVFKLCVVLVRCWNQGLVYVCILMIRLLHWPFGCWAMFWIGCMSLSWEPGMYLASKDVSLLLSMLLGIVHISSSNQGCCSCRTQAWLVWLMEMHCFIALFHHLISTFEDWSAPCHHTHFLELLWMLMCCAFSNIGTLPLMEDPSSLEKVSFRFTTKLCAAVQAFLDHKYSCLLLSLSCKVGINQYLQLCTFKCTSKLLDISAVNRT